MNSSIVDNALIVGRSKGNSKDWSPTGRPELTHEKKIVGIVGPNSDGLFVKNTKFYNFEASASIPETKNYKFVALESCAHCSTI